MKIGKIENGQIKEWYKGGYQNDLGHVFWTQDLKVLNPLGWYEVIENRPPEKEGLLISRTWVQEEKQIVAKYEYKIRRDDLTM